MYSIDNKEAIPERSTNRWTTALLDYYQVIEILLCPSDAESFDRVEMAASGVQGNWTPTGVEADDAARSFSINGFNDYFGDDASDADGKSMTFAVLDGTKGQVALFGEKLTESSHFYIDVFERVGGVTGNEYTQLEYSRHNPGGQSQSNQGASNYAFTDGSVQAIKHPDWEDPINVWGVSDAVRNGDR